MPNHIELLELLLKNRGISPEYKDKFLNPSYEKDIYNSFLLKDMERACVRIFEAIEAKEKIVIYSDYDCDGIPAAVIMNDFFIKINYKNFLIYIPDRHDEGYGLHKDAIDEFIKTDVKLLITFDLGITAIDEVAQATASGIDVIITDHHLPQSQLPPAYAIINPKQDGCLYPDKMLCGASIAYKLIQGLIKKYGEYWNINNGWEKWLLDMVGLATLADQVPLINENRVFAYYGLKVLQKTKRPGLKELFYKAGVDISKLNEEDITFTLAPRINAASRMASPMNAFETLATNDPVEARTLADALLKMNDERKKIVATIMKDIKKTLSKINELEEKKNQTFIVIGNPNWRVGILGLVASKIAEEYKKSVFVWGGDGGDVIRGSCRVWGNVNLVEIMQALPENSLLSFGGHSGAGGFTVSYEEIHFLEERLINVFNNIEKSDEIKEEKNFEASITIDDVTNENYNVIEKLAPFGMGNPKPLFLFENISINTLKEFGKDKNHLEITFKNSGGKIVKAITFFKTRESFEFPLTEGDKVNMIATFEKSTFGGRTELRLRIVDISSTI
jgi:single-stranded-DNA-specific exonuclease